MGGTGSTLRQEVVLELMEKTHFNQAEICDLYRQYRLDSQQHVLIVDRDYFRSMYQKVFPTGDTDGLADLVFDFFAKDTDGKVDFQHFILTLSDPLKGTQAEKTQWLFDFYDRNKDGRITKTEMVTIVQSIIDLNAGFLYATRHVTEKQLVDYIFQQSEQSKTGNLSKGDFMSAAEISTTVKYVLEGTMSAILSPYVTRKARTGSFGKARSGSIISVRRPSRSNSGNSDGLEVDMGEI